MFLFFIQPCRLGGYSCFFSGARTDNLIKRPRNPYFHPCFANSAYFFPWQMSLRLKDY